MTKYEGQVRFLPVEKSQTQEIQVMPDSEHNQEFLHHTLKKGQYDINYTITVLRIILDKCQSMRMNPQELQFTLTQSIQRLLAMLEVERIQK